MAVRRPTTGRLEPATPPTSPSDVSLRSPTWPHIPRKFTRPSHVAFTIVPNRLFSRSGTAFRVGSIPIARSTSRLASGYVGIRDWGQHVDPVGTRWERTSIWRRSRVLTRLDGVRVASWTFSSFDSLNTTPWGARHSAIPLSTIKLGPFPSSKGLCERMLVTDIRPRKSCRATTSILVRPACITSPRYETSPA
jgi:hypothetical protein